MKLAEYHVELLTPCFCAGADQTSAEIRVPSIRGQLRWWFRALGGTPAQEKKVFGGVHALPGERKEDAARASAVSLRMTPPAPGPRWDPATVRNPNLHYVWYYVKASSKDARWRASGAVPPGSKFTLEITERRALDPQLRDLLNDALEALLRFGGLGLRVTRGLGALPCDRFAGNPESWDAAVTRLLQGRSFRTQWMEQKFGD